MSKAPKQDVNYFVRHWRGDLPLYVSYWINGTILNLFCAHLIARLGENVSFDKNPQAVAMIFIMMWLCIFIITVWQIVGTWRSAGNYSLHSQKSWGKIAKFFLVLGTLGFIGTLNNSGIPQVNEFWHIASGNDPVGKYTLRVMRDSTELEFSGNMAFGAAAKFEEYLNNHPTIEIVHLNSSGGRVSEGRRIAKLIRDRNLTTYTASGCYSACIIAYAAGKERLIDKDVDLAFHQYAFPGIRQEDMAQEYLIDKAYLIGRGIKRDFVERIFLTSPDNLWRPSHDELIAANFITKYPSDSEVGVSGISATEMENFEEVVLGIPIYAAIQKADPEAYREIYNILKVGIQKGQSLGDLRKETLPIISSILHKRIPQASGESILDFTRLMIDQMIYLQQVSPYECYAFAMGVKEASLSDFPDELRQRELEVTANVINSYSLYTEKVTEEMVAAEFDWIINQLAEIHGNKVSIITVQNPTREEQPVYCEITIAMYEQVLKLPPERAVRVLRFMFKDIGGG